MILDAPADHQGALVEYRPISMLLTGLVLDHMLPMPVRGGGCRQPQFTLPSTSTTCSGNRYNAPIWTAKLSLLPRAATPAPGGGQSTIVAAPPLAAPTATTYPAVATDNRAVAKAQGGRLPTLRVPRPSGIPGGRVRRETASRRWSNQHGPRQDASAASAIPKTLATSGDDNGRVRSIQEHQLS